MESGTEEQEFNKKDQTNKGAEPKGASALENLFVALAYFGLFVGFIAAAGYGWTDIGYTGQIEYFEFGADFNAGAFFFFLWGSFASFAMFKAFAVFVKAANKYLNR